MTCERSNEIELDAPLMLEFCGSVVISDAAPLTSRLLANIRDHKAASIN